MAVYYWVGGSGTWDNSSTTNWATSSGGAGGFGPPNNADTVNFDANSGTAATVTVAATAVSFSATINKADINISLSGSPTLCVSTGTLTLTAGTITLNTHTLTCGFFSSNNSNARSIAFGTGSITVTGNGGVIIGLNNMTNFSYTGTSNFISNYSGATGTRSVRLGNSGGASISNAPSLSITGGTDAISMAADVNNLILAGYAGTMTIAATTRIYGNFTAGSGMTFAASALNVIFGATSGPKNITTNGVTLAFPVGVDGIGGSWQLQDNFTSTGNFQLTNGAFDANGKNVSIGTFLLGVGTKTLTLGSGVWTCAVTWEANTNASGLTVSPSTGTISMTRATAKTFSGGGRTWPTLNQGGAGALTIAQSNTFTNITNTVQPATVTLTAGTTQTVSAFSLSGTAGNLITLNTTVAGTQATLSDASGAVSVSYVSIKDINATGGAFWQAYTANGNVDAGNNLGWDFNAAAWSYMYNVRKSKRILPGV